MWELTATGFSGTTFSVLERMEQNFLSSFSGAISGKNDLDKDLLGWDCWKRINVEI